jgi:hypothetical protein
MSEVPVTPPPAPSAPAAPTGGPVAAPPGTDYPGKTLGIVGLILAIITSVIGLVISIIANNQSKAAGYTNTPAKVGIILGIIFTVLNAIWIILVIAGSIAAVNAGYTTAP